MMKIAWATDTHFNLAKPSKIQEFLDSVTEKRLDALFLTGDISESQCLHQHLSRFESLGIPVYFVLGNHDYYNSSIKKTNIQLDEFVSHHQNLKWMTREGVVLLTERTALVGCEGWWDGFYGHESQGFLHDFVMRQDYTAIKELTVSKSKRRDVLVDLAAKSIDHLKRMLQMAFDSREEVIVLTHVPPFKESCYIYGTEFPDNWLYHFCSNILGVFLTNFMQMHPKKQLTVLCGHTHEPTFYRPLPNLTVMVGGASYYKPKVYTTMTIK